MPMTIVITRNSPGRVRGFLASCMCEIAPGVYSSPRMTVAVRDRIWDVLESWYQADAESGILMTWPESRRQGGQAVRTLGWPQQQLWELNGVFLAKRGSAPAGEVDLPEEPTAWAKALSSRDDWVVVDTETTDRGSDADLIEVAVVGAGGEVVWQSLVKPMRKVSVIATKIHGLTDQDLRDAPSFGEIYHQSRKWLDRKLVIAYNAPFDRGVLRRACARVGVPEIPARWSCALERYHQWKGLRPTLKQACELEGIEVSSTHRAAADAVLVWKLVDRLARAAESPVPSRIANAPEPED